MKVQLHASTAPLIKGLDELQALLLEFDFADSLGKVINRFPSQADFVKALFTIHSDNLTTSGACNVVIRFEMTDFYTRLMTAIRAGDVNSLVIK